MYTFGPQSLDIVFFMFFIRRSESSFVLFVFFFPQANLLAWMFLFTPASIDMDRRHDDCNKIVNLGGL